MRSSSKPDIEHTIDVNANDKKPKPKLSWDNDQSSSSEESSDSSSSEESSDSSDEEDGDDFSDEETTSDSKLAQDVSRIGAKASLEFSSSIPEVSRPTPNTYSPPKCDSDGRPYSSYERLRLKKINRNNLRQQDLGLIDSEGRNITAAAHPSRTKPIKKMRDRKRKLDPEPLNPELRRRTRSSVTTASDQSSRNIYQDEVNVLFSFIVKPKVL